MAKANTLNNGVLNKIHIYHKRYHTPAVKIKSGK